MEQQPFYIGQKVVCVDDSYTYRLGTKMAITKGLIYTVGNIRKGCCGWEVDVGVTTNDATTYCGVCQSRFSSMGIHWLRASRFAPLNPPRVSAIPELLKAPVEERVDHRQPIKILTTDG